MNTTSPYARAVLAVCTAIAALAGAAQCAAALDPAKISAAEAQYRDGLAAFQSRDWDGAEQRFRASDDLIPHVMNAYMLSLVFVQRNDRDDALAFADKALEYSHSLSGKQGELEPAYRAKLDEIRAWARSPVTIQTNGKADGATRGGRPRPHVDVPADGTLGLEARPIAPARPPVAAAPRLTTMADTDLYGSDYRFFEPTYPSPSACAAACARDPQCRAYTYIRANLAPPKGRCCLKTAVPQQTANNCCVSGIKVLIAPAISPGRTVKAPRPIP